MEVKDNVETKEVKFNFLFVGLEHYVFCATLWPKSRDKEIRSLSDMGLGLSVVHQWTRMNETLGREVGQHKVTCYGASVSGKSLILPTYLPSQIVTSEYGDIWTLSKS